MSLPRNSSLKTKEDTSHVVVFVRLGSEQLGSKRHDSGSKEPGLKAHGEGTANTELFHFSGRKIEV